MTIRPYDEVAKDPTAAPLERETALLAEWNKALRDNAQMRAVLMRMYDAPNGCQCEVSNEAVEIWAQARAVLFPSAEQCNSTTCTPMSNNTHVIDREALRREGWQVIETPQQKSAATPKQPDDDYLDGNIWRRVGEDAVASSPAFHAFTIYRRRIPAPVEPQWHNPENVPADRVPKGWRFLTVGEANVPRSDEGLRFLARKGVFEFEPPITCEGADNFLRPNWTYLIPDTSPTPTPAAEVFRKFYPDKAPWGSKWSQAAIESFLRDAYMSARTDGRNDPCGSAELTALREQVRALEVDKAQALDCVARFRLLIDAAGLSRLSEAVQLGSISWYHKVNDCMTWAKELLAARPAAGGKAQP